MTDDTPFVFAGDSPQNKSGCGEILAERFPHVTAEESKT
jgi:hypothetical protein